MTDNVEIQQPSESKGHLKGIQNLKMWKPGQSGNPGGKSKKIEEMRALARDKSTRAMERIIELVESDDERVAFMAAKELLDRAWGKVKEVSPEDDGADRPASPQAIEIYIVRPNT